MRINIHEMKCCPIKENMLSCKALAFTFNHTTLQQTQMKISTQFSLIYLG